VSAYYNRGLTRAEKKLFDGAIADFDQVIRLDPEDALGYYHRGLAWLAKKEYDPAIADFDRVIALSPGRRGAYLNRGLAWAAKKDYDKAITDFDTVLKLDPNDARAYHNRGLAWAAKKEFGKAIADYDQAIRLNPKDDDAYLSRAWLLATCPDPRYHDPNKAVESATKACELTDWHEAHDLGGLAAVYAQTGNVAAATKWQARAIELMTGGTMSEFNPVQQVIQH
jgi:tetratricopeptide (TPR) repeat protein